MRLPIIPFNRPLLAPRSLEHTRQAFLGHHISGNGPYGRRCEAWLQRRLHVPHVLLTTSCTHALEMTALLLDLRPGDEVILPAFTFVSTANAYALRGAKPVFVDIRSDTLNLDETLLAGAITPRTKAIVVVHYAGVACEMDAILRLARRHRVPVIEDNAHGLFGSYRGRPLGTLGTFATLSFHETKNISCGEGGALLVNRTADAAAAEIIREKGTDRSRFLRGQVDKYTWQSLGSSYVRSDALAALLFSQLEHWRVIQARRKAIWDRYHRALADWARQNSVSQPHVPPHCRQSYHMYYLLMPDARARDGLIRHLQRNGINAAFHYVPLHLAPMGRLFGGKAGQCPVTERFSTRLIRLPFHAGLSGAAQRRVLAAVRAFVS
jgi:dTDP-4-amino-4,6-dideoxygalactose transaminase